MIDLIGVVADVENFWKTRTYSIYYPCKGSVYQGLDSKAQCRDKADNWKAKLTGSKRQAEFSNRWPIAFNHEPQCPTYSCCARHTNNMVDFSQTHRDDASCYLFLALVVFLHHQHEPKCLLASLCLSETLTMTALPGVTSIKALRSSGSSVPCPSVQKVQLYKKLIYILSRNINN